MTYFEFSLEHANRSDQVLETKYEEVVMPLFPLMVGDISSGNVHLVPIKQKPIYHYESSVPCKGGGCPVCDALGEKPMKEAIPDQDPELFDLMEHVAANWNCLHEGFCVYLENVHLLEINTVYGHRTEIWLLKSNDQSSAMYAFTDMTEKVTAYSEHLSDVKMMAEPPGSALASNKVIVWHDAVDGKGWPMDRSLFHEKARRIPEMFLRLKIDDEAKVRLVGKPYQYWQHWQPVICRSPGPEKDPLMKQSYEPMKRFAIWVLDRNDNNQLKIMDFSPRLYGEFSKWKEMMVEDPGGGNGPDWIIKGNGRRDVMRGYDAWFLDRAPFTDEEKRRIKAGITVNGVNMTLKDKLAEARRAHTEEEITAMLADPPLRPYQQQALDAIANSTTKTHDLPAQAGKTGGLQRGNHTIGLGSVYEAWPSAGLSKDFVSEVRQCQHEWVNAGFTSIRMVCKKCDAEKPC